MLKSYFSHSDIMSFEGRYRATFINSLGGFKSVCLIGTKNSQGQSNLAIFSSIVHIGASPPLIAFVVRPDSAERHTYENILAGSYYTINHIHEGIYEKAHQSSARYPRSVSEFEAVNLTEEYKDGFFAPYVQESNIQLGVEFKQKIDLTINGTIFMIGKIMHTYYPEECLQPDGFLDLERAKTLTCSGLDSYHTTHKVDRLTYAKPDRWPEKIKF